MSIFKGMLELVKGDNQNIYNSILAKKRLKKFEYGYIKANTIRKSLIVAYWIFKDNRFCLVLFANYPFCFDTIEFMILAREGQSYLDEINDSTIV